MTCNIEIQLTESIKLRPWRDEDAAPLVKYADDRAVWINLTDVFPHPYTREDALEFFAKNREWDDLIWAIDRAGEPIGGAGIHFKTNVWRRNVEIGYWLGRPFWGQGIASATVRALVDHAFTHHDIRRVQASVYEWNPASQRVLEKNGFTFEGRHRDAIYKDGKFTSEMMWAMLRDDWQR